MIAIKFTITTIRCMKDRELKKKHAVTKIHYETNSIIIKIIIYNIHNYPSEYNNGFLISLIVRTSVFIHLFNWIILHIF